MLWNGREIHETFLSSFCSPPQTIIILSSRYEPHTEVCLGLNGWTWNGTNDRNCGEDSARAKIHPTCAVSLYQSERRGACMWERYRNERFLQSLYFQLWWWLCEVKKKIQLKNKLLTKKNITKAGFRFVLVSCRLLNLCISYYFFWPAVVATTVSSSLQLDSKKAKNKENLRMCVLDSYIGQQSYSLNDLSGKCIPTEWQNRKKQEAQSRAEFGVTRGQIFGGVFKEW